MSGIESMRRRVTGEAGTAVHHAIARGTASPVVVTDGRWCIVAMNRAAESLLGCTTREVEGKPCPTFLRGRDRFGNHLPIEQCDVGSMARRGVPVHPFELDVVTAAGERIRAACTVIVLPDGADCRIVHILAPLPFDGEGVASRKASERVDAGAPRAESGNERRYGLTAREHEVLRLLAGGHDCHRIAEKLFISLPTVRNHVHNFLRKLDVHSQVEAVALAFRERLI